MFASSFGTDRVYRVLFLSIGLAGFLMRLACTTGLIASDDLEYSHYAQLISHLHYAPELNHYSLRLGLTAPVALIYHQLGVHEWTTFLLPLFASAASVPLLMILGERLVGSRAALLAGALFASFPVSLRYATILVPEPVAEFLILLALLIYIQIENRLPLLLGILTGLILGISYLTKESAAFVALAVFLDAIFRRRWTVAFSIGVGMVAIAAAEHAYYLASSGDLLFRIHAMRYHEESDMVIAANENLRYRLLKSYPRLMLVPNDGFGFHSIFALIFSALVFLRRPSRWQLLVLWAAVPWLYLNFGSSNLTHFVALPVADRYIEYCYPPLFLLAGWACDYWMTQRPWVVRPMLACIALVASVGLWYGYATRQQGWRTNEVAVLRRIAANATDRKLTSLEFRNDVDNRWRQSMVILAPNMQVDSEDSHADLVIGPDAIGLPSVRSVSSIAVQTGKP